MPLPDIMHLTPAQEKELIDHLSTFSLEKLRKWQDITNKQIAKAYNLRLEKVAIELNKKQDYLTAAVMRVSGLSGLGDYEDHMLEHYLIAALWASTGDDDEPLDKNYDVSDISQEAKDQAQEDVRSFVKKAGDLLDNIKAEQAGHDFWLTRNHHGAGFWDRGYPKKIEDGLTKLSHTYGEISLYVGDDGQLYFG